MLNSWTPVPTDTHVYTNPFAVAEFRSRNAGSCDWKSSCSLADRWGHQHEEQHTSEAGTVLHLIVGAPNVPPKIAGLH